MSDSVVRPYAYKGPGVAEASVSDPPIRDSGREAREAVVKSSLTGIGVTALAVVAFSPAGFGGMIGTGVASAFGDDHAAAAAADPYAKLGPYPSLLTSAEVSDIRGQLASTFAAMEITRAATDDRIEFIHELALHPGALSVAPARHFAKAGAAAVEHEVASARSAPTIQTASATPPTIEAEHRTVVLAAAGAIVGTGAPSPTAIAMEPARPLGPISFVDNPSDTHLQFASLLLDRS